MTHSSTSVLHHLDERSRLVRRDAQCADQMIDDARGIPHDSALPPRRPASECRSGDLPDLATEERSRPDSRLNLPGSGPLPRGRCYSDAACAPHLRWCWYHPRTLVACRTTDMSWSSASSSHRTRRPRRRPSRWRSWPTCWATTWSPCRTTRTRPSTSTPGRCSPRSRRVRRPCGSRPTSPACPCGSRRCSPSRWRRSTSSATAAPSSAWAPGRSGTRSWRSAVRGGARARRSRRSRRPSPSSAGRGASTATGPSTWTASSTGSRACTPARCRCTTCRSGSAPSSRGCSG